MQLLILFISLFYGISAWAIGTVETGYVVPHGTTVRVSAHGVCKKVNNAHASRHYFFSAKTAAEWTSFITNSPASVTLQDCTGFYRSCLDYLRANPGATSGVYTIDVDGDGVGHAPLDVYCDMTTDGGGWTLVWSNTRGGTNKPVTNISWASATTTTPLCSQANGAGVGCGTYLSNNKEGFNFFIGLDWWARFAGHNKNSEMMYLWSSNYGQPIEQGGKFNFLRMNSSNLYSLRLANFTQLYGSVVPGLVDYHGDLKAPFSTTDKQNDAHISVDCGNTYSKTPFWYNTCWTGSINGGGEAPTTSHLNGAYYTGSSGSWGVSTGIGAGNGWLFVREYEYPSNCTEIKFKVPESPSGSYWIDPDGTGGNVPLLVYCDMVTDGGGWTLIFNQKSDAGGFFANVTEASLHNVSNPLADRYSILSHLEGFRSLQGNFTFKISSPNTPLRNIWKQRTNPTIDQAVSGYVPVSIDMPTNYWGGLERNCSVGCLSSLMDGSVSDDDWWYAIGSYAIYSGAGIPYSNSATPQIVNQTQLWVRDDSFLLTTPRDCQDILEYGQSIGDGLYWVDPTSSGTSMQVYCDMTTNGGGWTKVFNQHIAGGLFSGASDALSKNVAVPTADHYSILDQLDNFKANGRYIFKMSWPGYPQRNIWVQTTNPAVNQPVAGYEPLLIDASDMNWGGLERNCTVGCGYSFMDGAIGTTNWHFAVASFSAYHGGIPSAGSIKSDPTTQTAVPHVELWTRRSEGNLTKRSCKEILNAGLSTGSGQYFIDPDGVGGETPFRVYCDMTTDGGGWTRVAYSNGTVTSATVPDDFLVNKYRYDLLGLTGVVNNAASINTEWFSKVVGTTDAMLKASVYPGSPFIDNGLGTWNYDTPRCSGTLLHTSRTAGCSGPGANDNYDSHDMFNIAINGGSEGIVPYHNNMGNELCHNGKGDCSFEFFLR